MTAMHPETDVLRTDYQKSVAAYWNNNPDDDRVDTVLGEVDGLYPHYGCSLHPRSEYFKAMAANNPVPVSVTDLAPDTIPHWEPRTRSELATGVEKPFLTSYKEGSFQYLMIVADKVGR